MVLCQLIYSSMATEIMPKSKLYKILVQARTANALKDVTGLLVFVDGLFLQVLEGEREVVTALMKKIEGDPRHKDVKIISDSDVSSRTFAAWRMAYVTPSAKELATWAGLRNTTTVEATLGMLQSEPGRVPAVLGSLLTAPQQE